MGPQNESNYMGASAERTAVSMVKRVFNFIYHPVTRVVLVSGLIACSIASFIGYTMLTAQVDSAKAQVDLVNTKHVLGADATVSGQVFLMFGILTMLGVVGICGLDLVIYIISRFDSGSPLHAYRNHRDWYKSLSEEHKSQFDNWNKKRLDERERQVL